MLKIENSTMNKKRSLKKNSKISSFRPDGYPIPLSQLTLVSLPSIPMVMETQNQHLEEQFMGII
jgi:hypothetical protein